VRLALAALLLSGCSASGFLADAMAESGSVYASDDDPELVRDAVPFALKTMEGVLVEQPEHEGLLLALASGFTQYGYAFVQQDADALAEVDIDRSLELAARARKLYLRARGYALRAIEARHQGFGASVSRDLDAALAAMKSEDVPNLYWTAASWGLAISTSKGSPEMLADFPTVEKLAKRALSLDEGWNEGALHELVGSIEAASPTGSRERARQHFEKAIAISKGSKAGPYVSLAESVSVKEQKAKEFSELLDLALAVDVDRHPQHRLANTVMKRRAERLKADAEDLFLELEE
jgi:predicted anti-sigma-YlaC factor YlaD